MRALTTLSLLACGIPAFAQLPTLTSVGEIGCSDCGTAAQFATIRDLAVSDSGLVLVVAGRWFVADLESGDGTPRVGFWEIR